MRYLCDNATAQCSRYVLFATSVDVAFTVSIATWLYLRENDSIPTTTTTTMTTTMTNGDENSIDLYRVFAYVA